MEQTNAIRAIRVGTISVNLHNVGYTQIVDSVDDDEKPVKALWVYFVGGRNVLLYSGDAEICEGLSACIDACMGQFLDLTHMTQPKAEKTEKEKRDGLAQAGEHHAQLRRDMGDKQ